MAIRYWLVVQPLDRARGMVSAGHVQVPWATYEVMAAIGLSDGIALYSPRERNPEGEPLRAFTGVGRVADAQPWRPGGRAADIWRRRVDWEPDAQMAPMRPLRDVLDFIRQDRYWGEQLRRGILEISRRDFEVIADAVRPGSPEPGRLPSFLSERQEPNPFPVHPDGWTPDAWWEPPVR